MRIPPSRFFVLFLLLVYAPLALAATKTWDGGGSGNNCSTAANWNGDTVPTGADDIVLNGTSTKDLTWDSSCPNEVKSWSQNSGYTGTVTAPSTFTTSGSVVIGSGTFVAPSGTLTIRGSFTKANAATFTHNNGTVLLAGTGSHTLTPGNATLNNLTIDNGLVGYWKLDEGQGTVAKDSSRFGHNGTLMNGPAWSGATLNGVASRVQFYDPYGLNFSGTNSSYVDCGRLTQIDGTTAATFTGWINTTSTTVKQGFGRPATNSRVGVNLFSDGNIYWIVDTGAGSGYTSQARTQTGWHYYTMVFNGALSGAARIKSYIDGVSQSTTLGATPPTSIPSDATSFMIGHPASTDYSTGGQDDVRVYNRALSASEVLALYNGNKSTGSGVYVLGSNLTLNGNLSAYGGTLDVSASNYNVTVGGNLNMQGDFTKRSGLVTLNGTNQTLSGSTIFNNLTATGSAARTLTFDYTSRQSVSGALVLQGTAGNLLSLRSMRTGSGARLLLDGDAGTQTIDHADVKDSNAAGGGTLSCGAGCIDSGNNTNWTFPFSTTTTLASSQNPSTFGSSINLTATVTPSAATGSLTFKDGLTTIGTATLGHGSGSIATSALSAGSHSLTVVYVGNSSYAGSTSNTLTQTVDAVASSSSSSTTTQSTGHGGGGGGGGGHIYVPTTSPSASSASSSTSSTITPPPANMTPGQRLVYYAQQRRNARVAKLLANVAARKAARLKKLQGH
jgi:hypothetical protein